MTYNVCKPLVSSLEKTLTSAVQQFWGVHNNVKQY